MWRDLSPAVPPQMLAIVKIKECHQPPGSPTWWQVGTKVLGPSSVAFQAHEQETVLEEDAGLELETPMWHTGIPSSSSVPSAKSTSQSQGEV